MLKKTGTLRYVKTPQKQVLEIKQAQDALEPTILAINTNGTATVTFGAQQNIEETKQYFGQFKPYHIAGVACFLIGIACCVFRFTSTFIGLSVAGSGIALTVIATFISQHSTQAFYGLCAIGCFATYYIFWRHGK